jgi:hypothetical protein
MQKLWILSDRYVISALQQLSLLKLHRDLCAFKLEHISATIFIDRLEFAYSNTAVTRAEEKGACIGDRRLSCRNSGGEQRLPRIA